MYKTICMSLFLTLKIYLRRYKTHWNRSHDSIKLGPYYNSPQSLLVSVYLMCTVESSRYYKNRQRMKYLPPGICPVWSPLSKASGFQHRGELHPIPLLPTGQSDSSVCFISSSYSFMLYPHMLFPPS